MTSKEINKEIQKMLSILGWSNPSIEYAGSGNRFKSTKTAYKFRYLNKDGVSCFRGALNGSVYHFLKWQFRTENCDCDNGTILRSNYGSSIKCVCPKCGGYNMKNPKL